MEIYMKVIGNKEKGMAMVELSMLMEMLSLEPGLTIKKNMDKKFILMGTFLKDLIRTINSMVK